MSFLLSCVNEGIVEGLYREKGERLWRRKYQRIESGCITPDW
jgi:hypothetical protein